MNSSPPPPDAGSAATGKEAADTIEYGIDPWILDHPAQRRSSKEVDRVLSILDELKQKGREG